MGKEGEESARTVSSIQYLTKRLVNLKQSIKYIKSLNIIERIPPVSDEISVFSIPSVKNE